jgi:hypothetical protein
VDGRVARALITRRMIAVDADHAVAATDLGRDYLNSPARRLRRGRKSRPLLGRAVAVLKAVEQLEAAVPLDAEVRVGIIQAAADDVLMGLRRYAHQLSSRGRTLE